MHGFLCPDPSQISVNLEFHDDDVILTLRFLVLKAAR